MDQQKLQASSQCIVRRNLTNNVAGAAIEWRPLQSELVLTYYVVSSPTEEDSEECEISMAELLAAFPQILKAETKLVQIHNDSVPLDAVNTLIFQRRA